MSIKAVTLPGDFNLGVLPILHAEVSAMIEAKQSFVFDGSGVNRVDAASIQFLVQVQHSLTDSNSVLANASERLLQALNTLGFDPSLQSNSETKVQQAVD